MIVISDSLVAADGEGTTTPIIGWQSRLAPADVTATTADADHPASNLANPATHLYWLATYSPAAITYLTFALSGADDVDYVALAGHNFGDGQHALSVETSTHTTGSPAVPVWVEVVAPVLLADNGPVVFRFTPQSAQRVRLKIAIGSVAPRAAVAYVGKLLVLERSTHADHIPINLATTRKINTGRSESGNYLGRISTGGANASAFSLTRLRQAWYREKMAPFIAGAAKAPFFFAWKPAEYPTDVGYCWMTNDPQPTFQMDTKTMALELQFGAAVLQ